MTVGKIEGAKSKIEMLRSMVDGLGPQGSFTLAAGSGKRILKISETLSVELTLPLTVEYTVQGDEIVLMFSEPYPIAHYRILSKRLTDVRVAPSYITIGLDWAPDITLEVTDG